MCRLLFLLLVLCSAAAQAEAPARELASGVGAVHVQEGQALLADAEGRPALSLVRLPSGVFYTQPGHQRLTGAFLQLQADRAAAEARADALQHALALRSTPPPSSTAPGWLLLAGGAGLFVVGLVVGVAVR